MESFIKFRDLFNEVWGDSISTGLPVIPPIVYRDLISRKDVHGSLKPDSSLVETGHGVTEVRMEAIIAVSPKPTSRPIFQNPISTNKIVTVTQAIRSQRWDAPVGEEPSPTPHHDVYVVEAEADTDGAGRNTKSTIRLRRNTAYEAGVNTRKQRRILIIADTLALGRMAGAI